MSTNGRNGGGKTGGRQPGTPNKITASFKELVQKTFQALEDDPNEGGMLTWAKANKTEFYKISSKLIPTEVALKAEITEIEISKTLITQAASVVETKQLEPGAATLKPTSED